ncbi:hypothetical protein QOZ80_4BG0347590 [Eleusine coracana subsp. coracana]|nr:hypothetical protein QOZ80_4BG0347590 [Eleusine coracana subsp. coracana]
MNGPMACIASPATVTAPIWNALNATCHGGRYMTLATTFRDPASESRTMSATSAGHAFISFSSMRSFTAFTSSVAAPGWFSSLQRDNKVWRAAAALMIHQNCAVSFLPHKHVGTGGPSMASRTAEFEVPRHVVLQALGAAYGSPIWGARRGRALVSAAVTAVRHQLGRQPSSAANRCYEISVYLNDLPDNDFNAAFKAVPSFLHEQGEAAKGDRPLVMVFGAPGSFYGRLFPAKTMHLVCSSFSIHWLSKVPQELVDGVLVNKGNVWAGTTSSPAVTAAYARHQNMRSEFIAEVLQDMASRGVIGAEEVDAYNVPLHAPCEDELRRGVELEGSFEIVCLESYHYIVNGPRGDATCSTEMAMAQRAMHESMLVRHFRADNIGVEFAKAAEARFMGVAAEEDTRLAILMLSLRRK